jgi:nucleotide-binding universal stress UspA family protein
MNADLIVVSTQGKGMLARLFLGSVTEKTLQSATVDVLALPPVQKP